MTNYSDLPANKKREYNARRRSRSVSLKLAEEEAMALRAEANRRGVTLHALIKEAAIGILRREQ